MQPTGNSTTHPTLNSWKEIGDYLKRDARTAQRWERDKGLPVHRVPGKRAAIYAYTEEIDAWLKVISADVVPETSGLVPGEPDSRRYYRRPWLWAVYAIVLGTATTAIAAFVISAWGHKTHLARVSVFGTDIHAFDGNDRELWSHRLQQAAHVRTAEQQREATLFTIIADINRDGAPEVLVGHNFGHSGPQLSGQVLCFSERGEILWAYRPAFHLKFGNDEFRDPWMVAEMIILGVRDGLNVLAVFNSPSWPSMIVRIDGKTGTGVPLFVNSGHLHLLESLKAGPDELLVAGGFNIEYGAPVIAVMNPLGKFASPQSDSQFQLDDSSFSAPQKYIALTKSEFGPVATPEIVAISVGDDHLEALVREHNNANLKADMAFTFRNDAPLTPISMRFSPDYWLYHDIGEQNHKLDHDRQHCPLSKSASLGIYEQATGWTTAQIRPAYEGTNPR